MPQHIKELYAMKTTIENTQAVAVVNVNSNEEHNTMNAINTAVTANAEVNANLDNAADEINYIIKSNNTALTPAMRKPLTSNVLDLSGINFTRKMNDIGRNIENMAIIGRELMDVYGEKTQRKELQNALIAKVIDWPMWFKKSGTPKHVNLNEVKDAANIDKFGEDIHRIAKGIAAAIQAWSRALDSAAEETEETEETEEQAASMSDASFLQALTALVKQAEGKEWADVASLLNSALEIAASKPSGVAS
jgi:hypothetical protein